MTTIEQGLQIAFGGDPANFPDALPETGLVALVVVGTDHGLCGPVNREIARSVSDWCQEHEVGSDGRIVAALGSRATRELRMLGIATDEHLTLPGSVDTIAGVVSDLIRQIDRWRTDGDVDRVLVFFQHPLHRTHRTPRMFQVLPPDVRRLRSIASRPWPTNMLPYSPHDHEELLSSLLRQDLFIALLRAVAEAKTAEHGARLSSMQAAERNIDERLTALRNESHQLRQATITAEILDVVSGFEALEGSKAPSDGSTRRQAPGWIRRRG